ncbi:MAG: hypothetical protein Kow00105_07310 [Phycisphaeraceae bacterium]
MLMLVSSALLATWAVCGPLTPQQRRAFRLLSLINLLMCLDELGSLHERAGSLLPFSPIVNLLPAVVIAVPVIVWSVLSLYRSQQSGIRGLTMLVVGYLCLAATEPLDMLGHVYPPPPWFDACNAVLEEGAELLGACFLIAGALTLNPIRLENSQASSGTHEDAFHVSAMKGLRSLGHLVIGLTLPLLVLRSWLGSREMLKLHTRGDFGAAPAVIMFGLTFLACLIHLRQNLSADQRTRWLVTALVAVLVSVELGCNLVVWVQKESVRSPLGREWCQAIAALLGYSLLLLVTRLRPVRGSSRVAVA